MAHHPYQDPHCTYWDDGSGIPVFQRPGEFNQLLGLFESKRPMRILEIGTYYGGTLRQWLRRAVPGACVVSVDRYDIPRADNRPLYPLWCAEGVTVAVIAGDSRDHRIVAETARYGLYDFILIDADHTYEAVKADYQHYGAMCAEGGVIVLHDIVPSPAPEIQVARLWDEIRTTEATTEYVDAVGQPWGGIGVVWR